MQICPACKSSNPDGIDACKQCSSQFGSETPFPEKHDNTPTLAAVFTPAPLTSGITAEFTSAGSATAARQAFSIGLSPGDVIADRYEIISHIGEGGMGSVYKALDRELEREVALKTIRPDLASNGTVLRRFKQEVLLARRVTHQNVIRIYDLGVFGPLRFLTMEYFEGEDLCAYLERRKNLGVGETVAIIRQVCEGLRAAHHEGVIHRDLKPQNILIDANGQVRILDFGLARGFEVSNVTHTGLAVGTPDYMSPEQAQGAQASVRSDIYAVGLTFYELLIGETPFKGETAMARLVQRTIQRPPSLTSIKAEIPQHLDNIVMRCLAINPEERYESADALLADLQNWEEPQAPSLPHSFEVPVASGTTPTIPIIPAKFNYKKPAAVGALAVLLCGIGGGYWYRYHGTGSTGGTSVHTNNPDALALVVKGRVLLDNRKDMRKTDVIKEALEDFTKASQKDSAYPLAWAGIADANLELYRINPDNHLYASQAAAAAQQGYNLNKNLLETELALGSVDAETGKLQEAVNLLESAVKQYPHSDQAYLRLARAYLLTGRSKEGIQQYEKAVELNPYNWNSQNLLARAYFRIGRNDDALTHYKKAAQYNSQNAEVHEAMGVIYSRQSRWPKCIEEFQKAIKIKPTASIYGNFGTALYIAGRYGEAAAMFQKAVELDNQKYWLYGLMANAYKRSNKDWEKEQEAYDHAIELASQQLEINPQKASILGDLALYYAQKGGLAGLDEAREKITRARSIDKNDNQLMYIEGLIYARGGDKDKAFESIKQALLHGYSLEEVRRDPDLASVREMTAFKELVKKLPGAN